MVDNCIYCEQFMSKYSLNCQGYMSYCIKKECKINPYKAWINCDYNKN